MVIVPCMCPFLDPEGQVLLSAGPVVLFRCAHSTTRWCLGPDFSVPEHELARVQVVDVQVALIVKAGHPVALAGWESEPPAWACLFFADKEEDSKTFDCVEVE